MQGGLIKDVVGQTTYKVWLEMLRRLTPYGRTHRLSVIVAGMLTTAVEIAGEKSEKNSKARKLIDLSESVFDDEVNEKDFLKAIEELMKDAGVKYKRINSRGERYSIAKDALYQYIHWEDMPWEA
ncbi:MAG: hypothetical protein RIC85_01310 [Gammaproteobacteria bacterium]